MTDQIYRDRTPEHARPWPWHRFILAFIFAIVAITWYFLIKML